MSAIGPKRTSRGTISMCALGLSDSAGTNFNTQIGGTLPAHDGFLVIASKSVLVTEMEHDGDAKRIRERASRLFDLATRSQCEGRPDYAAFLTNVATEMLEHARDIEQRDGISPGDWQGTSWRDAR